MATASVTITCNENPRGVVNLTASMFSSPKYDVPAFTVK